MFRNGSGKRVMYKAKYNIAKVKRRRFRLNFVHRIKLKFGCLICGYKKSAYAIHFDHLGNKLINVSSLCRRVASMKRIKDEIRKCRILCANCHMEETFENKEKEK